jgi:hypothetical protein
VRQKYEEIFDSELTCSICHELFIHPINLSCSHAFCFFCIEQWTKNKLSRRECPICRKPITSQTRQLVVENLIDKIIVEMDVETQELRKKVVDEREKALPFRGFSEGQANVFQPIQERWDTDSGSGSDSGSDYDWSDSSDGSDHVMDMPPLRDELWSFHSTINIDSDDDDDEDGDNDDDEDVEEPRVEEDGEEGEDPDNFHYDGETEDGFGPYDDVRSDNGEEVVVDDDDRDEDDDDEDDDEEASAVSDTSDVLSVGNGSESADSDINSLGAEQFMESQREFEPESDSLSESSESVMSSSSGNSESGPRVMFLSHRVRGGGRGRGSRGSESDSDSEDYFST